MHLSYAKAKSTSFYLGYGEGGIRTLGTLLGYGALAKRCFRPLSHLTRELREYGVGAMLVKQSSHNDQATAAA
jgi:hypothetical protein